jgi:hypothetical protein
MIAKEWKSVRLQVSNAFETAVTVWHELITAKPRRKGENVVDLINALKRSIANDREAEAARSKRPRKAQPDNVLRRLRRRKPSQRHREPRNEHDELLAIFEMAVPPRWSCLCARRVVGNSRTDLAPEWTGSDEQGCTLLRQLLSAAQS